MISYLSNRKQFVHIENNHSDVLNVICGVPQGSILGPKLFILYINDLCNVSKLLNFLLFADDTNIFFTSNNIHDASVVISRELIKLSRWFAINKLSLNVSKTNYMVFTYKKDTSKCQVHIDKYPIERVFVTKFLGVLIDEKLTWKEHINFVINKIKRSMAMLFKIKNKLNQDSLLTIYDAVIQPYLSYCCEVWGRSFDKYITHITIIQKKAVRLICKCQYKDHTSPLFKKLKILKFSDLVNYKTGMLMYKAKYESLPSNIQQLFTNKQESLYYSTRQKHKFAVKYARTSIKSKCLSVYGVKLWNKVPSSISLDSSFLSFKRNYKSYLLCEY